MFAMEINVQRDPSTGEQRVLSAGRIDPPAAAASHARGIKVYDDGRKVVYEVSASSGGVSTSGAVENGWSSAQVDQLIRRAAGSTVAASPGGQVTVTPPPVAAAAALAADLDDLSPPSCAPPSIPSSPPAQVRLQREPQLGMTPPVAVVTSQPGPSPTPDPNADPNPNPDPASSPVTMVFLGYHDVEDASESRRLLLLGLDGAPARAEVVLIDEDDEKSLREKTVTDVSAVDGTAADLVSGRPATSEAVSTELSSDGREAESGSSPRPPNDPDDPAAAAAGGSTAPPPGLTPATGTDKRKRCQCCILM